MAEEQPSNIQEGADPPDVLPANAEDRKTAKAMSSLESNNIDDDSATPKKEVDLKALNDAITKLGGGAEEKKTEVVKKEDAGPAKPVVKVDQADVALLVDQLDISKTKATDLLRAHDADAVKAMTAWVETAV